MNTTKIMAFVLCAVAAISLAAPASMAVAEDKPPKDNPGVGSIDRECAEFGFAFGIAKWEWNDDLDMYVLEDEADGYDTTANGTAQSVDWTSNPAADGVLEKAGQDYFTHPGGTSGTVEKSGQHDISHLTLCGQEHEVPEFGVILAVFTAIGATAGLVAFRKSH